MPSEGCRIYSKTLLAVLLGASGVWASDNKAQTSEPSPPIAAVVGDLVDPDLFLRKYLGDKIARVPAVNVPEGWESRRWRPQAERLPTPAWVAQIRSPEAPKGCQMITLWAVHASLLTEVRIQSIGPACPGWREALTYPGFSSLQPLPPETAGQFINGFLTLKPGAAFKAFQSHWRHFRSFWQKDK